MDSLTPYVLRYIDRIATRPVLCNALRILEGQQMQQRLLQRRQQQKVNGKSSRPLGQRRKARYMSVAE